MTDKVQKIRETVENRYEYWKEKESNSHSIESEIRMSECEHLLLMFDSQEEPVSEDLEKVVEEIVDPTVLNAYGVKEIANRLRSTMIEPVSEDLEEASKEWLRPQLDKSYANYGEAKMMELTHFDGYAMLDAIEFGAEWQKANLWKPADGDDLPDIGREVIVLINDSVQRNIHAKEYLIYRIGFGHRPNPDGWDGKNIDTDEVTHYTPKLYDKGGWNAPNIVYWLDARLPYEENKIIKEL